MKSQVEIQVMALRVTPRAASPPSDMQRESN